VISLEQISTVSDGDLQPAFVFRYSGLRMVALALFCGLVAAFGLLLLMSPDEFVSRRATATEVRIYGAIWVLLFGGLTSLMLLVRRGYVALTQRGIFITSRFRRRLLRWEDVVSLSQYSYRGIRFLQIEIAPSPGSPEMRAIVRGEKRPWWRSPPGGGISLEFLGDRRAKLLIEMLHRYLDDPSARREIGTEAGLASVQSVSEPRLTPVIDTWMRPSRADVARMAEQFRAAPAPTTPDRTVEPDQTRISTVRPTVTLLSLGVIAALAAIVSASLTRSGFGAAAIGLGLAFGVLVGSRLVALEHTVRGVSAVKRAGIAASIAFGLFVVPRFDHSSAVAAGVLLAFISATLAGQYFCIIPDARRRARAPVFGTPMRDTGPPPGPVPVKVLSGRRRNERS